MNRFITAVVLFNALLVTSCGFGGEEPGGPGVTGTWVGVLTLTTPHDLTLTLIDNGGVVTGIYLCASDSLGAEPCPLGEQATNTPVVINGSSTNGFAASIQPDPNVPDTACVFTGSYSSSEMIGTYTCPQNVQETGAWAVNKQGA